MGRMSNLFLPLSHVTQEISSTQVAQVTQVIHMLFSSWSPFWPWGQ